MALNKVGLSYKHAFCQHNSIAKNRLYILRRTLLSGVFASPAALALALTLGGGPVNAATWVGGSNSNDWFTGANWDGGIVPSVFTNTTTTIDNGGIVAIIGQAGQSASLDLGVSNNGTLSISSGGSLALFNSSYVGRNGDSKGTLTLTGANSRLTADGTLYFGYEGEADVIISGGASINKIDGGLYLPTINIAFGPESKGTVTVTGAGSSISGIINVGTGGTGALSVENGARVEASGTVGVGGVYFDPSFTVFSEGSGSLKITGSGSTLVGQGLSITSGLLLVSDSATLNISENLNATSKASVIIEGKGTSVSAGILYSDNASLGGIKIRDSADVSVSKAFYVGNGAEGLVSIAGEGTTLSLLTTDNSVGHFKNGTLTVTDKAILNAKVLTLGINEIAIGTLNIGASSDAAAATAGIVNVASEIGFGSGRLVFNHTDTDYDFSSLLTTYGVSSDKALIEHIAGVTTLSGASSAFGGITNVLGGELYVTGALGGSFNVSGGILGGTGTIGTSGKVVTVASGGTLSPGSAGSIGTLSVAGDLVFEAGSAYAVHVNGSGDSDLTSVAGIVTIADGAQLQVYALGGQDDYGVSYAGSGYTYTIVTATGGLSGTFTDVQDSAFLTYTSSSDANNAYVTVALKGQEPTEAPTEAPTETPTEVPTDAPTEAPTEAPTDAPTEAPTEAPTDAPTEAPTEVPTEAPTETPTDAPTEAPTEAPGEGVFEGAAVTGNQIATARALDTLAQSNALWWAVANVADYDEARLAFDQLSGAQHASSKTALVEDSQFVRDAINNRIRSAFEAVAAPSVPVLAYGPDDVIRTPKDSPFVGEPPAEHTAAYSVWATGFGSWGKQKGNNGVEDIDRSTGGFLAGGDAPVFENWRLGVLAGYSQSNFDSSNFDGRSENYHVGAYAGAQWNALSFRSGLAYTFNRFDTDRTVAFGSLADRLSADYDAYTLQAFGELGYRIQVGRAAFEPYANLAHVRLKTDGFTETGGIAALSVDGDKVNTTFTTLGARFSSDIDLGATRAIARGGIGWRHAFGDVDISTRNAFVTGGDAFTVSGTPIDKDTALLEAGLDFVITPQTTLGISYSGQVGSDAYQHGGNARFSVKF